MSDLMIELAEQLVQKVFCGMDAMELVDVIYEFNSRDVMDGFAFDLYDIAQYVVNEHDSLDNDVIDEWLTKNIYKGEYKNAED